MTDDPIEAERLLAAAEDAAQRLAASLPPGTCPDVAWLSGALYAAATVDVTATVNGLVLRWPALGPFSPEAERLVSWETAVSMQGPAQHALLAARFHLLAELCRAVARRR